VVESRKQKRARERDEYRRSDGGTIEPGDHDYVTRERPTSDYDIEFSSGISPMEEVSFATVAEVRPQPASRPVESALGENHLISEELRLLVVKLRIIAEQRPFRCIGIASALGNEGKTTLSIGIAAALARETETNVLLLEADLRRPGIENSLGLPAVPGVGEWIQGEPGPVALRLVTPPGFSVLSAGKTSFERPELLSGGRMSSLLRAARQQFDYVVVDCPPILPVADTVMLQDRLDGFLLVVRSRASPRDAVKRAAAALKPDRIQGILFNDSREALHSYDKYYSHYRYRQ
jgi:Mrp family chromosome partitioning ATPase